MSNDKEKLIEELKYNYENWNAGNFYNEDADYNESLADFILQKQEETRKDEREKTLSIIDEIGQHYIESNNINDSLVTVQVYDCLKKIWGEK